MADTDEKQKQLKRMKTIVRSLLISAKGGVVKHQLLSDYKNFIGSPMPLRELGYKSLDHFVYDNSDVIQEGVNSMGEEVYIAVVDASTQHVASLVAKQKQLTLKEAQRNPKFVDSFSHTHGTNPNTTISGGATVRRRRSSSHSRFQKHSPRSYPRGEQAICSCSMHAPVCVVYLTSGI